MLESARAERSRAPLLVAVLGALVVVNVIGGGICLLCAYRRELRVYLRRYRGLREEIELESSAPQPARERRHHKRADRPVPQEN